MAARPRESMPDDVSDALKGALRKAYDARPPYQRNDYLRWIREAKPETRARRIAKMIAELKAGDVYMGMGWRGRRG